MNAVLTIKWHGFVETNFKLCYRSRASRQAISVVPTNWKNVILMDAIANSFNMRAQWMHSFRQPTFNYFMQHLIITYAKCYVVDTFARQMATAKHPPSMGFVNRTTMLTKLTSMMEWQGEGRMDGAKKGRNTSRLFRNVNVVWRQAILPFARVTLWAHAAKLSQMAMENDIRSLAASPF